MNWVLLVLLGSVFNSLKNVATRKVGAHIDVYTVAVASNLLMLPVLWLSVLLFNESVPQAEFWRLMLLMLPLEMVVMLLFFKALTSSKLSYSFPFVSFMPLFVAIGSYFILDEQVSTMVYLGAGVIVAGAFLINLKKDSSQADVRGIFYILGVAALWGYLIPMGSLAVTYSSAQLYPAIYFSLATILFLPIFFIKRTTPLQLVVRNLPPFILIGILFAFFQISNWYAYSVGPATAISALAMISIPLTSIFDALYHKESISIQKVIATLVMTVGAVIIITG